jgi:hypothetical protein
VEPRPRTANVFTENKTPFVVLATRKQSKPIDANRIRNWQPVSAEQAIEFETVVGEKVLLKVEEEGNLDKLNNNDEQQSRNHTNQDNGRKGPKKRPYEEEFPALGGAPPPASRGLPPRPNQHHRGRGGSNNNNNNNSRGGRNAGYDGRGGGRGGRGSRRGAYRSLDDAGAGGMGNAVGGGAMQY